MKFLIGTKQYMTQLFDEKGRVHPATVLAVPPSAITQVKTMETDGYDAVQVGFGSRREIRVNKAQKTKGMFAGFREVRTSGDAPEVGSAIDASTFAQGDVVAVAGISKAKGFQGVVKRHGFHGGPRTHGQKHSEREAGSIGGGGRAGGRVAKGMRMAGRMGGERVTVKNLTVLSVDAENGLLVVSGAVPGRRGTIVEIYGN